jgi:hypothetical protein
VEHQELLQQVPLEHPQLTESEVLLLQDLEAQQEVRHVQRDLPEPLKL